MNNKINKLLAKLGETVTDIETIKGKLQIECNKVFDNDKRLAKAITDTEDSREYTFNSFGDIASWHRFHDLVDYSDCREYLEAWFSDRGIEIDSVNDCLMLSHGDDNLIIQDDTRRDNGVWQSGKLVIGENEYRNDDNEIDEDKRNALIERHMEKTGHFPGVFRADSHGNVFLVDTQKKAA